MIVTLDGAVTGVACPGSTLYPRTYEGTRLRQRIRIIFWKGFRTGTRRRSGADRGRTDWLGRHPHRPKCQMLLERDAAFEDKQAARATSSSWAALPCWRCHRGQGGAPTLLSQPFGFALLGLVAFGLLCFAGWRIAQCVPGNASASLFLVPRGTQRARPN